MPHLAHRPTGHTDPQPVTVVHEGVTYRSRDDDHLIEVPAHVVPQLVRFPEWTLVFPDGEEPAAAPEPADRVEHRADHAGDKHATSAPPADEPAPRRRTRKR